MAGFIFNLISINKQKSLQMRDDQQSIQYALPGKYSSEGRCSPVIFLICYPLNGSDLNWPFLTG